MRIVANQQSRQSIDDFKQFVKKHPKLIQNVRKEQRSWQEVYENWVLLGEDDPIWSPFKDEAVQPSSDAETKQEPAEKNDFVSKMVTAVKKMDINQMNEQINKMSQSISSLQSLLSQFSGSSTKQPRQGSGQHPFSFRKD
ncbi:hypothetical protein MY7_1380 [Bacillus sp. 5B6]|nr:hypothetical protein MY7_1380 [Bacillus sp. 5B6]